MREDHEARVGRKVGEAYRRAARSSPGTRERLLERIAGMSPPRPQTSVWARLASGPAPAPLRFAMAAGLVLVVGVMLIGRSMVQDMMAPDGASPGPAGSPDSPVVRFDIAAPEAGEVTLVGDFNGWDRQATPMRRGKTPGSWTVSVPLARGRHVYGFVVDGVRWVADPGAPLAPADGFGGVNSIIVVSGPGAS